VWLTVRNGQGCEVVSCREQSDLGDSTKGRPGVPPGSRGDLLDSELLFEVLTSASHSSATERYLFVNLSMFFWEVSLVAKVFP
jgi:hypothetical protein